VSFSTLFFADFSNRCIVSLLSLIWFRNVCYLVLDRALVRLSVIICADGV
jgi:hypothetical protein